MTVWRLHEAGESCCNTTNFDCVLPKYFAASKQAIDFAAMLGMPEVEVSDYHTCCSNGIFGDESRVVFVSRIEVEENNA